MMFRIKTTLGIIGWREATLMNHPTLLQATVRIIRAWILPCQLLAFILLSTYVHVGGRHQPVFGIIPCAHPLRQADMVSVQISRP